MSLKIFTITHNTKDYGSLFVVRGHVVVEGASVPDSYPYALAESLEKARSYLPLGLCRIPRDESDDPVIVESWL